MKNQRKGFIKGIVVSILIFATIVSASALQSTKTKDINYRDIKICIDGKNINPKDASGNTVEPFIMDGTTYLPVRAVADALGMEVSWDAATSTVTLSTTKTDTEVSVPKTEKKVTMYAADGRTTEVPESKVEAYKKVGWFTEPVSTKKVTMYAADGRTTEVPESKVEAYKAVGWYTTPVYKADGSRKAPYIASSPVNATFNDYSFYDSHKLQISCSKIIKGVAGNVLAAKCSSSNDTPNGNQEWVFFDIQLKHISSSGGEDSVFKASKVLNDSSFYKSDGTKLTVADKAWNYYFFQSYDAGSVELYPGGSARVVFGILIDKYDGNILLKVPYNGGKNNTWIRLNTGNNIITTAEEFDKYIETTVPVSEQGVRLKLKNSLPMTIHNFDYNDKKEATFNVTDFEYTSSNTSASISFSGSKTYDVNGSGQSRPVKIGWKLYDSEGYVIDDGTATGTSIKQGEKFKNCDDTIYSLEPGSYTLEIMSVN